MRLNSEENGNGLAFALAVCALAALGIAAMTLFAFGADNDQPCYTQAQAREKFPNQYLYWRTAARCWYGRPRSGRATPATQAPSRSERPHIKIVRWNEYNELDAAADRDTYFTLGDPPPIWRLAPVPRFTPWEERIQ